MEQKNPQRTRNFFLQVADIQENTYVVSYEERVECLDVLKGCVRDGVYTKSTSNKEIVESLLTGESLQVIAEKTENTTKAVRSTREYHSKLIFEYFGADIFDKIREYAAQKDVEGFHEYVRVLTDRGKNRKRFLSLVPQSVVPSSSGKVREYKLSECREEFRVLQMFSHASVREQLKHVNQDKLLYLVRFLQQDGVSKQREVMLQALTEPYELDNGTGK